MKFHGDIVITFAITDANTHIRSAGTCRTRIGELARKQQCSKVKTFEILGYENETL